MCGSTSRRSGAINRAAAGIAGAVVAITVSISPLLAAAKGDPKRGEYVSRLGGCSSCHTDTKAKGAYLAGGLALKTPFGTFYAPNITPDRDTGIGGWSEANFINAMTEGTAPDGSPYYPAFPYTSYTRMTRQDLIDLKAYLDSITPVRNAVPPHDLSFPYNIRFALNIWKWLFFTAGTFQPDPKQSALWNRGAYIVTGPGHCGECHTVRNVFGATNDDYALAGAKKGPDGEPVPNITPHASNGIGKWSVDEIIDLLKSGDLPDGDMVGSAMADVVDNNSSYWTDRDLKAVAEYLLSVPKRKTP